MNKNVVLFLTTPNSTSRIKMCLENFKQLEKLGYDIITLTTTELLPEYIYEKSKYVIHDYTEHKIYKKDYYEYFKESGGKGYFFWDTNYAHTVRLFHDTHFPSLLRNTKTLISFANSLCYENYFFVEDDHYFKDEDLNLINGFFNKLDVNDLIVFSFKRYKDQSIEEYVYCTWFHFGKVEKSNQLFENVAYTRKDFLNDKDNYLHFYEHVFKNLIQRYKTENMTVLELKDFLNSNFLTSKLNQIYSYKNLADDSRCNLIYNYKDNNRIFYYKSTSLDYEVNVKVFIDKKLTIERNLSPNCWYYAHISDEHINQMEVLINNTVKKSFENLKIDDVVYNGELI